MLKVGDTAPPIDAVGSDGKRFALYEQSGLCTVIYFFPKAFTPGCTTETREFRKHYIEIDLAGAIRGGDQHGRPRHPVPLRHLALRAVPHVGDHDRSICRAYDVLWPLIGVAHRVTYVVAPTPTAPVEPVMMGVRPKPPAADAPRPRWTVEAVFHHELKVGAHRDEVLRFVDAKLRASRPAPRSGLGCAP